MVSNEDKSDRKSAQDIINQLSVILRTAQIHDPNNIAVTTAIDRFLLLINPMIEAERSTTLELVGEFFYILIIELFQR